MSKIESGFAEAAAKFHEVDDLSQRVEKLEDQIRKLNDVRITRADCAEMLDVSLVTVDKRLAEGKIEYRRVGKLIKISKLSVLEFLEEENKNAEQA